MLTVSTDASFAPDAEESHGSFIVQVGSSPIFWRSGRQGFVTLSTAEAELTEIIEGMIAGESIHVILAELFPEVPKIVKTDNLPALVILTGDGGSWRTRHLKLRAAFARQSVAAGDWAIQHTPGESMIADIGTKPLAAARLTFLKDLMGMGKLGEVEVKEEEKEKGGEKKEGKEKQDDREVTKETMRVAEATKALQLITLAASISMSRAEDGEDDADEGFSFEVIMAYTVAVVLITLLAQRIWDAAVRGVGILQGYFSAQPGSLPMDAVDEEPEPSLRDRPAFLATEDVNRRSTEGPDHQVTQRDAPLPSEAPLPPEPEQAPQPEGAPLPDQHVAEPIAAAAASDGSTVPFITLTNPPVDIMQEWDEIEREERRVRAELNSVPPGHPMLGPVDQPPAEPEPAALPFEVITTRYGSVYHARRNCRYLTAPCTGPSRLHRWCDLCRRAATQSGRVPTHGAAMCLTGWGSAAHSDPTCSRAENARTFACCTDCLGT